MVTFGASLGGEGKGDCITVGLAKNKIDLIDGVGSFFELSNVEAFLFLDVSTFDLGDDNVFGNANLFWDWDGNINGHFQRNGDQRNAISLGLVFSSAVLVFSSTITLQNLLDEGLLRALKGHCGGGHVEGSDGENFSFLHGGSSAGAALESPHCHLAPGAATKS